MLSSAPPTLDAALEEVRRAIGPALFAPICAQVQRRVTGLGATELSGAAPAATLLPGFGRLFFF